MVAKPYYEEPGITIYHGDCREILPSLPKVDLVLTDPPYGIGADKDLRGNTIYGNALAVSKSYGKGEWDNRPPDETLFKTLISISDKSIFWGGNYFILPPSKAWLVWNKENGSNGYADCELA